MNVLGKIKKTDWLIVLSISFLVVMGILAIYSAGILFTGEVVSNEYIRQIVWGILGILAMLLCSFIDTKYLKEYAFWIYIVALVILLYTRLFGKVVNGARSWIGIGSFGIQPSEFAKLATIIFLSKYFSDSPNYTQQFKNFLISLLIVSIPVILILSQPDLGTSIVFFPIYFAMAYIFSIDKRYWGFILLVLILGSFFTILPIFEEKILRNSIPMLQIFYKQELVYILLLSLFVITAVSLAGYLFTKKKYYSILTYIGSILFLSTGFGYLANKVLKEYQIMRLAVFLDPKIDPLGSGWNIIQSITAIGSGGILGKGFLQGTQSHYRYLPQQSTDFIFSILAEEFGFIGCFAIFLVYFFIVFRMLKIMRNTRDTFAQGIIAGIISMMLFHFAINVGMAMGIMPITGIPLLFLSYGGSSLLSNCVAFGIVISIGSARERIL